MGGAKLTAEDADGEKFGDEKDTKWGWTLGRGLEYAFNGDLSARVEYHYTDPGTLVMRMPNVDDNGDLAFHAVRVGLSWHFGGI